MTISRSIATICLLAVGSVCASLGAAETPKLTFEHDVRPILKVHCFRCHGDEAEHEGSLDLRLVRLMQAGGDSGPAVVAGKAGESLLVQRIADGEMPPKGSRLPETDLATIRTWIEQGANTAGPEPQSLADFDGITRAERAFWSFQPIGSPAIPVLDNTAELRSPIDAFLRAKLKEHDADFSPEADRLTLVRRAYFDLLGLPPTPAEVAEFLGDESPDAWERLIDRLLARPQYGERWGRHWLDVAGYADSDGYSEKDLERKYAYKYRDYVVRSLNADKPWNAFLREQLAGDELLTPPYTNLSPEQADLLAATGFLRMAPDGTGDASVDQQQARNDVLAETLKIVSSSTLGLTVGCAQCHNHLYDPIPQADYYRLRAIFEPGYDVQNWRAPGSRVVSLWTNETRATAKAIDDQIKALAAEKKTELEKIVSEVFESELEKLPEEQRAAARQARETAVKNRTSEQKQILKDHPSLNVNASSVYLYGRKRLADFNKLYDTRTADLQAQRPQEDFVPCLTEVPGKIPTSHVFYRGDITQPKEEVSPASLRVISRSANIIPTDDPELPTSGRRLALANWLTSGEHPLTARVLVNRSWMHHFGRGIVATPADFGQLGARPTHPELLDFLASRFMHDGWNLKKLHRTLMSSAAYRQTSRRNDKLADSDPDNNLLGHMSIRRLEAEVLRDSILAASGKLNYAMFGKPVPVTPDDVGQVIVGVDTRDGAGRFVGKRPEIGAEAFRRSVYVQVRRTLPLSMLEAFDAPLLTPNCDLRSQSTVAPQALLLMNNEFVVAQSLAMAQRVQAEAGGDRAEQVRLAWRLTLASSPDDSELQAALDFLGTLQAELAMEAKAAKDKSLPEPATRALASFCQALVSSNAFLYID
jgi:mono/diheme cytochrome c family protein